MEHDMPPTNILELFLLQLTANPAALAVAAFGENLSYAELDQRSTAVAMVLQRRGIGRGDLVPILAERSIPLFIAFLGVLKAGAAYVPIDSRLPQKRIDSIVRACKSSFVLSTPPRSDYPDATEGASIQDLLAQPIAGSLREVALTGHDIAYVIFTSGTTGLPKGVVIEQEALLSLLRWHNQRFQVGPTSRTTLMASVGFDVSQWEVWSTLGAGASIHLPDEITRANSQELLAFYARHEISHAFVPTVMVPDLLALAQPANLALRYLFTAGEKLKPVETHHLPYTLVDYYGPTEATIFATCRIVDGTRPASIGRPIGSCEAFILDDAFRPVPDGSVGELCLAGTCLARGYLGDPELTAQRFVKPDWYAGRIYRTGDLARWLRDGEIEFLGRRDDQVKIRGHRVELGDVEAALLRNPVVKEAVVLADDLQRTETCLVAFVVPRDVDAPRERVVAHLREELRGELPTYMLPAFYVCVPALPVNSSGKLDKAALRARLALARAAPHDNSRFEDEHERRVASSWSKVLGHGEFGRHDSFFDVGGHSLLATALIRELSSELDVKTYVRDVYEHPTLSQLASALRRRTDALAAQLDSEPVRALREDVRLPEGLERTLEQSSQTFEPRRLAQPRHVLITGATGFVGAHLLAAVLGRTQATVHCLVRQANRATALARLRGIVQDYQVKLSEEDWQRIRVYPCDLALPRLGMAEHEYGELAALVDVIYHSASAVNFIQPYSYMKRDNVEGLRHVLEFSSCRRLKPVILLSTISVYSWGHLHTGKTLMREDDDLDQNLPAVIRDLGYVRSKWVMEKIADLAASHGLPLMTFRLGYAMCDSRTGAFASYQWWSRLVETCLAHAAIPDLRNLREGLTTVDYMVEAIAAISRQPDALGKKFNLIPTPNKNLTLKEFFERLGRSIDREFRCLPFASWVSLWERERAAPLYPLLSMFKDNMYDGKTVVELYQDTYLWDCSNVQRFLEGTGICEPELDAPLLRRYVESIQVSSSRA
jgi:amino acid adenylation domain-containing protein/thioester reductase-like protein